MFRFFDRLMSTRINIFPWEWKDAKEEGIIVIPKESMWDWDLPDCVEIEGEMYYRGG